MGLPIRGQRIDAKPFRGQAIGLLTLDDQLDDVGGQERQVNQLHDPALGEVLACCDLLECLTILDSVIILMRLGDAADQSGVDLFRVCQSQPVGATITGHWRIY